VIGPFLAAKVKKYAFGIHENKTILYLKKEQLTLGILEIKNF
jgi:hypothetical protein